MTKKIMILPPKFQTYESEASQFINQLKKQNPKLEESQRAGRALLWDKEPIDLDLKRRADESRVKQQPYVYHSK
ncbi:MAG: DUF3460 family protein [Burkholderiaceae bacterium]|jgi:hypothetical protein|nr:DUF3460 family protein [Burkholderiaceae bacterium]